MNAENLEVTNFNPTEKSALVRSLPKPLDNYPPLIQLFIGVAEKQHVTLPTQRAFIAYAVYTYGEGISSDKNGSHSKPLFIEKVSQILGIPEKDVKMYRDLIEQETIFPKWERFNRDLRQSKRKRSRSNKE